MVTPLAVAVALQLFPMATPIFAACPADLVEVLPGYGAPPSKHYPGFLDVSMYFSSWTFRTLVPRSVPAAICCVRKPSTSDRATASVRCVRVCGTLYGVTFGFNCGGADGGKVHYWLMEAELADQNRRLLSCGSTGARRVPP
jgi:hypothetical protein